jgi:hypothetical protein
MTIEQKIGIVKDFIKFCEYSLQIENLPKIEFTKDKDWVLSIHSFGQYKNDSKSLKVYIGNRNLADTLRTLSHELVHHRQNELGLLHPDSGKAGSDIENQANSISGVIMRNYGKKNELIYESKLHKILNEVISNTYTIYSDMDGVLTDFDGQFEHYYGMTPREYTNEKGPVIFKKAVDDIGVTFWSKMPLFPGALDLWSYISQYNPIILSSPSSFKYAEKGKLIWIKENLRPGPSNIIFKQTGHKEDAISNLPESEIKKSILIDDYYRNIMPWKAIGAIGIVHKSAENTINILQKFRL